MEQPTPEHSAPPRSSTHTPSVEEPPCVKRERGRRVGKRADITADLLATLALPLLVLGLVVSRLSLGIAVRRRRDKHHGNRSHEPRA